jgi:hypothetical protein
MQARAMQDIGTTIEKLMGVGAAFPKGSAEFGTLARVISMLNGLMKKKPEEAPRQPLPVPPTPPGAGLGGMGGGPPPGGAPPGGAPPPMGGPPMGMPGGIAPGGEV